MADLTPVNEIVAVPLERYAELEKIEKGIPSMIEEAIKEYKKNSLKRLHERDKENPEAVKKRVQRYIEKHRDEINERRREKRKEQKRLDNVSTRQKTNAVIIDMFAATGGENFKRSSQIVEPPLIMEQDITVRFDD